ncbi:hypothetical protein XELAEV_18031192mg [Xenopus laevis]|uniref:Uncharacterized protein n=1 Tax=Xenopus laevis TaxID=8355 RepID=A0A974CNU3_XENLA|nr:hypothetical protein XELAEV_18031192mg [Xenopus laevis]
MPILLHVPGTVVGSANRALGQVEAKFNETCQCGAARSETGAGSDYKIPQTDAEKGNEPRELLLGELARLRGAHSFPPGGYSIGLRNKALCSLARTFNEISHFDGFFHPSSSPVSNFDILTAKGACEAFI